MIKELHFKNFKILRDARVPLGPMTLLVGPNGSGKSTVLEGLRLLHGNAGLDFAELKTIGSDVETVELSAHLSGVDAGVITLRQWGKTPDKNRVGKELVNREQCDANRIQSELASIRVFAFDPRKIQQPAHLQTVTTLAEDGSGLAAVLDELSSKHYERFDALNAEVARWFREYDRIMFEVPSPGQKSFMLRNKHDHHAIPARFLSHGTLVALAILALAYLPNPPTTVGIEEPEHGVHPRLLQDIKDALCRLAFPESVGETRPAVQVVATTHSPYLLDMFRDSPEDVVIANRDADGVSFNRLSELPNIRHILGESPPLGDLWYSGILGGIPAQP
jgi:predicted ATPase